MSIEAMKLALEALAPLEKLFTQADEQGLLAGANVDCQIATIELRKSAYAASDIRRYLDTTPPPAQPAPLPTLVTEEMHVAAVKVLQRANGLDGLPRRMLDAMLAAQPAAQPAPVQVPVYHLRQFGDVTKEQLDRYMATGDINPQSAPVPKGYKQSPEHSEVFTKAQLLQYGADCMKAAQPAVPLTDEDLERCRQWFGAVQDANKQYLTAQDCVLAEKLYLHAGMRVPDGIKQAAHGIKDQP